MKKFLLATSLLSMQLGLFAEDCKCEDVCSPKSLVACKCICEKVCPETRFYIFGDFLYWYGKESDMSYAMETQFEEATFGGAGAFLLPVEIEEMSPSWDPGFSIGIGVNISERWNMRADWTHFHNHTSNSASVDTVFAQDLIIPDDELILISPWVNPVYSAGSFTRPLFWDSIRASWHLKFDVIDFSFKNMGQFSKHFSLRPYFGLRFGRTRVHTSYSTSVGLLDSLPAEATLTDQVDYKSKFLGAGLIAGFQPSWNFGKGFSLFGDCDLSLLWGQYTTNRTETPVVDFVVFASSVIPSSSCRDRFYGMQAILDLAIGLRYEMVCFSDAFRILLQVAWENHTWFDNIAKAQLVGRLDDTEDQVNRFFGTFQKIYTDLSVSGGVARLGLAF